MLGRLKNLLARKTTSVEIEEKDPGKVIVRAGGKQLSVSLPPPSFSAPAPAEPVPPIKLASPACPYCGVIQDPPPQRRRKCRDCSETIYPWTDQETRTKYLLTAEQHEQRRRVAWDAAWRDLNRRLLEASEKENWGSVHTLLFQQARMLFDRGGDHMPIRVESQRAHLMYYRNLSHTLRRGKQLTITTQGETSCVECQVLAGHQYSIDEAMELMPLPCKTCLREAESNPHGGWCTCYYTPNLR